jgi:predicted RND superfamily exporter protein
LGRNKILKYKQDIKGKQLVLVKKRDGDICDSELVKALKKGELEAYQREELFGGPHVYSINSLPPLYNQYQDGPVDYKSFNKVILSSPKALQNIANSTESYFRVNGVTYKYQEK